MMVSKSWWQQVNEELGFYQDERTAVVRGVAIRNGYLVLVSSMLVVALYQGFGGAEGGILWVAGGLMWLSWLFLLLRRVQVGGWQRLDEWGRQRMNDSFLGAYLIVAGGILVYGLYRLFVSPEGQVSFLFNLPIFLALFAILGTHISYNTLSGHFAFWLAPAVIPLATLLGVLMSLGHGLMQDWLAGQPLPDAKQWLQLLVYFIPALGLNLICLWAAWRTWQNEREVDDE
ncbi:MAG: hypothetical protein ACPGWR_04700 [Ardenticatenaceae bacterium]